MNCLYSKNVNKWKEKKLGSGRKMGELDLRKFKLNTDSPRDTATVLFLGTHKTKERDWMRYSTPMFTALPTAAKRWKQPKCLSADSE